MSKDNFSFIEQWLIDNSGRIEEVFYYRKVNGEYAEDEESDAKEIIDSLLQGFKAAMLESLPRSREYAETTGEPTFVEISATGAVTGYNEALDDVVAALETLVNSKGES